MGILIMVIAVMLVIILILIVEIRELKEENQAIKETKNILSQETLSMRAKFVKLGDILRTYEENKKDIYNANAFQVLRKVVNIVLKKEDKKMMLAPAKMTNIK